MKKLWAVLLLLVASGQVFADEGMWVLKELNKQNLASPLLRAEESLESYGNFPFLNTSIHPQTNSLLSLGYSES